MLTYADFQAHPLYNKVEEAPGFIGMLERFKSVRPVVEAVIRQEVCVRVCVCVCV